VGNYYSLHEVFYDKKLHPMSMTEEPIDFAGDTAQEVIDSLQQALEDVLKTRVIDEDIFNERSKKKE
jgi:hypothetical protein